MPAQDDTSDGFVQGDLAMVLPASAAAEGMARSAIRDRWPRLPDEVLNDLLLVVSELVSNAVQHGEPSIRLHVRADPFAIDVTVLDHGPRMPVLDPDSPDAPDPTTGRGLQVVHRLADRWGVDPRPAGPGKSVWATLAAARAASTLTDESPAVGPSSDATERSGDVVLSWSGEIDLSNASTLGAQATRAARDLPDGHRLVLDLSEVTFLDSIGTRALLMLRSACLLDEVVLILRNPSTSTTRLLDVTGLTDLFTIARTGELLASPDHTV